MCALLPADTDRPVHTMDVNNLWSHGIHVFVTIYIIQYVQTALRLFHIYIHVYMCIIIRFYFCAFNTGYEKIAIFSADLLNTTGKKSAGLQLTRLGVKRNLGHRFRCSVLLTTAGWGQHACTMSVISDLASNWTRLARNGTNLGVSFLFILANWTKMKRKLILKSLRFVPFGANLAQLMAKPDNPAFKARLIATLLL